MTNRRLFTPLLAGITLVVLAANAVPTVLKKRRLETEKARLECELEDEERRAETLVHEIFALRHDAFCLERAYLRAWNETPAGARPFRIPAPAAVDAPAAE